LSDCAARSWRCIPPSMSHTYTRQSQGQGTARPAPRALPAEATLTDRQPPITRVRSSPLRSHDNSPESRHGPGGTKDLSGVGATLFTNASLAPSPTHNVHAGMQTDEMLGDGELQKAREQLANARAVSAKLHAELEFLGTERAQEKAQHQREMAEAREAWDSERAAIKREHWEAIERMEKGKKQVQDELIGVRGEGEEARQKGREEMNREKEEAVAKLVVEKQAMEEEVLALRRAMEQAGEKEKEREQEWAKERARAKEEKLLFQEEMVALRDKVETESQSLQEERERKTRALENQIAELKASLVSVAGERERERGAWEREREREKSERDQAWEDAIKERRKEREVLEGKTADAVAELRRVEAAQEKEREEGAKERSAIDAKQEKEREEGARDRSELEAKLEREREERVKERSELEAKLEREREEGVRERRELEAKLEREREERVRERRELEAKLAGLQAAMQSVEQESQAKEEVVRLRALCDELEDGSRRMEEEWAAIEEAKVLKSTPYSDFYVINVLGH